MTETEYVKKKTTELDMLLAKVTNFSYSDDEQTMAIRSRGLEEWEVYHNLSAKREALIIELLERLVKDQNKANEFRSDYGFMLKYLKLLFSKAGIVIGLSISGVFGYWVTTKLETAFPDAAKQSESDIKREKQLDDILNERFPKEQKK